MKIMSWYQSGIRAAVAGAAALVVAWSGGAAAGGAAPPPLTFTVDENCKGTGANTSVTVALPCGFLPDPGAGGLPSAMTYTLSDSLLLIPGDVILIEPSGEISDVIRFNLAEEAPGFDGVVSLATLVFYSDNSDGVDAPADTGFPTAFSPTNVLRIPEIGPEGNNGATYTPLPGQPGFFLTALPVTYVIQSDSAPEPATLALLAIGLAGLGFSHRRKQ